MMAMGGMEIILILGLLAGGGSVDIVSTLPAKEYLKARDIEVSADKLMELAVQTPDSPKKQIAQLMALSHLASDTDLLKNSPKAVEYRKKLGDITQGKLASDPNNFASNYARKTLLALEGQKDSPPGKRSWKEGVKMLPEKANLIGFVDLGAGYAADRKAPEFGPLFDIMPKEAKESFWTGVEKIGNLQVDSIGFALSGDDKISEMVIRFTGRGNADWLISSLTDYKELPKGRVGANGEAIRTLASNGDDPAITIVGSTEVLVGGYPPDSNRKYLGAPKGVRVPAQPVAKKNHQEVIDRLLVQRGKISQGPLSGILKADFAKVPADAGGVVVGFIPKEMRDAPMPMPNKVVAHAKRGAGGIDLLAFGTMVDETAAKGFIEMVGKGRDLALQDFKRAQGMPPPIPGFNVGVIVGMMESVQLQSNGNEAQLRVLLPDDAMMMIPMMFAMPMAARAAARPVQVAPPQPAPKVEEKKE